MTARKVTSGARRRTPDDSWEPVSRDKPGPQRRMAPLSSVGLPADAAGGPAHDPTKNVGDLVQRDRERADDLRDAYNLLYDEKILRMETVLSHVEALASLRAQHNRELREAESNRLNSIRQIDREDVQKTAAAAVAAIQTLQAQTNTTAETLRTQVSTTASTIANQLTQLFAESNKRLSALELASSEGRGKQAVADPQMERLASMVEQLAQSQAVGTGKTAGGTAMWGYVAAGIGILFMLSGFFMAAATLWLRTQGR